MEAAGLSQNSGLWQIVVQSDIHALRFFGLIVAVILYGICGSPTPDRPGVIEATIGLLLLFAVNVQGFSRMLGFSKSDHWQSAARLLLGTGLVLGLGAAAVNGAEISLVIRDFFPFMFLFLPLMLSDVFEDKPQRAKVFLAAVIFAGLAFSLRSLGAAAQDLIGFFNHGHELMYLANAPGVLLSAFLLMALSAHNFLKRFNLRALGLMVVCFTLSLLPIAAMALSVQRASIGFLLLALLVLFLAGWRYHAPARVAFLSLILIGLSLPFLPVAAELIEVMRSKTMVFGLNMRLEEWAAVWQEIVQSPFSVLFGRGWGGTFQSPAVAGITVNFTHSLLSSGLLKTGVLGLLALMIYLAALARQWSFVLKNHRILALGLAGPFLINVFLYASYKSLDFGFLLLLVVVFALYENTRAVASGPRL
jgi:O-antigen ligase